MRNFVLAFLCLLITTVLYSQTVEKSINSSRGNKIGFLEFKPSNYSDRGDKHPVIIFLHGIGERGNGSSDLKRVASTGLPRFLKKGDAMNFRVNGKNHSFVVLAPQLPRSFGNWQNYIVEDILEYAEKNLNIDRNRIYLTGLSLGGGGVWNFASASKQNASKLAAIVPVCGTCAMSNASNIASEDLPIWAFHAKNDGTVSVNCTNNAVDNINKLKPKSKAKKTIWPSGGHAIWDRVYDPKSSWTEPSIYEWLLAHSRSGEEVQNEAPLAITGEDITISAGLKQIELDGSESYDPDGDIVRFRWKKVSGPSLNSSDDDDENELDKEKAFLKGIFLPGVYIYELTVTDNKGASATATIKITVTAIAPIPNKRPVANPGDDQIIRLPKNDVIVDGNESEDADGKIVKYEWNKKSGPSSFKIENRNTQRTRISDLEEGTYVFSLTVTDDKGLSASSNLEVIVREPIVANKKPVAKVGKKITIQLPDNEVELDGSQSTDEDGEIAEYEWTKIQGPSEFSIANRTAGKTMVRNLEEGNYVFRLKVTDNDDETATADISVEVRSARQRKAPVAKTGNDITVISPTSVVLVYGNQSYDEDGKIVKYQWSIVSGVSGSYLQNASATNTRLMGLKPGNFKVRLTVTDDDGLTDSREMEVTVNPSNKPDDNNDNDDDEDDDNDNDPGGNNNGNGNVGSVKAEAGEDISMAEPANSGNLVGENSTATNTRIVEYEWSIVQGPRGAWIEDKSAKNTRIRSLTIGIYTIRLRVTDDKNRSSEDEMTITVTPRRNYNSSMDVSGEVMESQLATTPFSAKLAVYPNPAISQITIRAVNEKSGKGVINIYDASGKLAKRISVIKNQSLIQQTVDISALKPGLYHVDVIIDNKTREVTKFIKQ